MMASIAEKFADHVILTDDNPRSEDPAEIVKDMLAGMDKPEQATVEHSRLLAAQYAVENAAADGLTNSSFPILSPFSSLPPSLPLLSSSQQVVINRRIIPLLVISP